MVIESVHIYVAALAFPWLIKGTRVRPICLSLHPVVGSHRDTTHTHPPPYSHEMPSILRNLFGSQNQNQSQSQPPKSRGVSPSRPRPAPAVADYKPPKSGPSEPTPSRSGRVKRSHSTTRSHVPSPLRDVTNDGSQRPALQRSSTSRSRSESRSTSSSSHQSPTSQYSGPGAGEFHLSP